MEDLKDPILFKVSKILDRRKPGRKLATMGKLLHVGKQTFPASARLVRGSYGKGFSCHCPYTKSLSCSKTKELQVAVDLWGLAPGTVAMMQR